MDTLWNLSSTEDFTAAKRKSSLLDGLILEDKFGEKEAETLRTQLVFR